MKLLIGGSSSKFFHLKAFANALEKLNVECRLVHDIEYYDGFPSRNISNWFQTRKKFTKLVDEFKPDAIAALKEQDWTGNIRELRNVVERLIILGGNEIMSGSQKNYSSTGSSKKDQSVLTGINDVKIYDILLYLANQHPTRNIEVSKLTNLYI